MTEISVFMPDFKLDHTMLRVKDLGKSLDFYTRILGMKILRQNEYPAGQFTNTFIGYTDEDEGTNLELTYNWNQEEDYKKRMKDLEKDYFCDEVFQYTSESDYVEGILNYY